MKIYNCVWCGCELGYKDNVCHEHQAKLEQLKLLIQCELDMEIRERNFRKWQMVEWSRKVKKLIERQLDFEKSKRLIEDDKSGELLDHDQRRIFIALGIAV